jgi:TonB family protein
MNTRIAVAIVVAVACHAALFAQNFSTVSGSIVDQSGASLPGVTVAAVNITRGSRQEVTTDRNGRFELIGLTQGSYRLEADLPGFETFRQTVALGGQDASLDITLEIGSLEEMVTVTKELSGVSPAPSERYAPRPATCGPASGGAAPSRIGGQIRTPRKLRHVSPIYPEGAPSGVVKIDAVIGTEGLVTETKVTTADSDALARAAVDAVRQWEFDPTLLNCEAVDVRMTVTVEFR